MEVDLVICFDANVSPLRMIQRMGRTGRKHDGRVVVLACEGTELKGYMRKQATSRAVKKHMQNGGMNSFNFHPSPRMVPHFVKPELRFEELSIEKFVRNTKKVKNDLVEAPNFLKKLTDPEASLLGKYFLPDEKTSKPSLIAFPHFQAFPSRVHRVMHSSRTGLLIDVMQLLQGIPFSRTSVACGINLCPQSSYSHGSVTGNIEPHADGESGILESVNDAGAQIEVSSSEVSISGTALNEENHMLGHPRVLEIAVPPSDVSPSKGYSVLHSPIHKGCSDHSVRRSRLLNDAKFFEAAVDDSTVSRNPPFDEKCQSQNIESETEGAMATDNLLITDRHCGLDEEFDLSPRLTNLMESGFVPESPLSNAGSQNAEGKNEILVPEPTSPPRSRRNLSPFFDEEVNVKDAHQTGNINLTPVSHQIRNPFADGTSEMGGNSESPSNIVFRSPLQNLTNSSCSKDWHITSDEKSGTGERPFRLKRLRRIGDLGKERLQKSVKEKATCPTINLASRLNHAIHDVSNRRKVKRPYEDARDFIDVEAEVSSEDMVQDSEEDDGDQDNSDAYEASFIDDRVEPTAGASQADDGEVDMMAIYRRSLYTQSPFQRQQNFSTLASPQSMASIATAEGGECTEKTSTLETPQSCSKPPNISVRKNPICSYMNVEKVSCQGIPSTSGRSQTNKINFDSREKKIGSSIAFSLPVKNLEKDFCSLPGMSSKEQPLLYQTNENDPYANFSDDQFYEGLDLDALEAEAAKLVSQRRGSSMPVERKPESLPQNTALFSSPSFDLGIL